MRRKDRHNWVGRRTRTLRDLYVGVRAYACVCSRFRLGSGKGIWWQEEQSGRGVGIPKLPKNLKALLIGLHLLGWLVPRPRGSVDGDGVDGGSEGPARF